MVDLTTRTPEGRSVANTIEEVSLTISKVPCVVLENEGRYSKTF